jgi:imidazolonepropionase
MKPDNWMLIRGARQLVTLHQHSGVPRSHELDRLGLIADGSLLMRNGIIEAVGPTRRIENMAGARHADEIDAAGRVVMPAFIDPHACLVPVPAYRHEASKPVQTLPAGRLEAQADELLKLMARHGTATVGSLSGYACDTTGELKILRALRARNRKPLDIVSILYFTGHRHAAPPDRDAPGRAATGANPDHDLLHLVARRKLANVAAVRCGASAVPSSAAESLLAAARSLALHVRVELLADRDIQLVEKAVNLRALSVCAPGPYRSPEIEALAGSSTVAILLPHLLAQRGLLGSSSELIDHGVRIALGSGLNPENGGTASMQTVIQMACEHLGLSLPEAISAATVNAACALGVAETSGTLERGKLGDLLFLNASDYREIPLLAGTNLTYLMIKRGVILFKEDFPYWPAPD